MQPTSAERQAALRELRESNESLVACFERIVTTHRDRTALFSDNWQSTYYELNRIANRLARSIVSRATSPGDRVAILMQHDTPAVAAVLGALKAGAVVVALNPTHPVLRLQQIVDHSGSRIIVTDSANRTLASDIAGPDRTVIDFAGASTKGDDTDLGILVPPDQIATLGYTSGSTGQPKAVMMTHNKFRRNVTIHTESMSYTVEDRIPLFGSLSSGQGFSNIWEALLNGAALFPFPVIVKGVSGLADWMNSNKLTVYSSSASIFRSFMATLAEGFVFPKVRAIRLSSEPATSDDFRIFQRHFRDDCLFLHTLSSSETGNIAWSRRMKSDSVPEGRLPIGLPSQGHEVLIVDEHDNPVEPGTVGEIVVQSRYLSNGYWRDPELTAKRFSPPIDNYGTRRIHMGDLAKINAEGMLEFFGRRDDQVKIRGNRISIGEIEQGIHRLFGIERAVVEAIERQTHEPLLVGFVVLKKDQVWSAVELRRSLRAILPDFMIPSEFAILKQFPLTPTGKIDREKLRQELRPLRPAEKVEPGTETEMLLAGFWAEIFELADISRDDDFFVLGGDSLMAAVVGARVYDALKVELSLATFADHPILADLATAIDEMRFAAVNDVPQLVPLPFSETAPMSLWQERTWQFSQTAAQSAGYTTAQIYQLTGSLDVSLLRDCMELLVQRHEILRTTFEDRNGIPTQVIHPTAPTALQYIDLADSENPSEQAQLAFGKEITRVFDLTQIPLFRFTLIRLHNREYRLLRVGHHILYDGASWLLYFRELGMLYDAKCRGSELPLTAHAPMQYRDYAVWQRNVLHPDGATYKRTVAWWKEHLSSAPSTLTPPFKRPEPQFDASAADGAYAHVIERRVSHQLNALASEQNATRLMIRLAAFAAFLCSKTEQFDVTIGMYMGMRNRQALENMFGYFSNLAPLRFRCDPKLPFVKWLSLARGIFLGAEANSTLPLEILRRELELSGIALPEINVIFHVWGHRRVIDFANIKMIAERRQSDRMPWGFTIVLDDQAEDDNCQARFDPRIYNPAGVRAFIDQYVDFLNAIARSPEKSLEELLVAKQAEVEISNERVT